MECIASEKGDTTENCDPNSKFKTDTTKNVINNNTNTETKLMEETSAGDEPTHDTNNDDSLCDIPEQVEFTVIFNKQKYEISFGYDVTIKDLKAHLERICQVPQNAQKLLIKGMAKDEMTLRNAGIVKGCKVMLVGSKMDDILAVTSAPQQVLQEERSASQTAKEPLSVQKIHRKVLDKGVPPDAMPGVKGIKEPLPHVPLSGMLNKQGGKVRLTFKLEHNQLWLGTKERTEKLAMTSIKNITSEPIKDHEEYHIMGLQLGPTEASRYWVYWVPAQYVEAIKDAVLGTWQFF